MLMRNVWIKFITFAATLRKVLLELPANKLMFKQEAKEYKQMCGRGRGKELLLLWLLVAHICDCCAQFSQLESILNELTIFLYNL